MTKILLHLAVVDRKPQLVLLFQFPVPHKPVFLKSATFKGRKYPQNTLNKMKAGRNNGANPNPEMVMGLGQPRDAQHRSASSLFCIMAAPLQRRVRLSLLSQSSQNSQWGSPTSLLLFTTSSSGCYKAVVLQLRSVEGQRSPGLLDPPPHCRGTPWVAHAFRSVRISSWVAVMYLLAFL